MQASPPPSPWQRFRRNRWAVGAVAYLLALGLLVSLGRPLLPDPSAYANRQVTAWPRLPPGSQGWVLALPTATAAPTGTALGRWWWGPSPTAQYIALAHPDSLTTWEDTLFYTTAEGLSRWLLLPEAVATIDPTHPLTDHFRARYGKPYQFVHDTVRWVAPGGALHEAYLPHLIAQFRATRVRHLRFGLGTDTSGRDLLSRLVLGGRISLGVGALAVLVSLVLGVGVGAAAGYLGGRVDGLLQGLMTVLWSLPSLLLAIALAFVLGRGFVSLSLAIGLSVWVDVARVVRGEVLSLKTRTYVLAARVLGLPRWRILGYHILPSLVGPVAILAASSFATAILLEAGLSFLGLGVAPPTPSWGGMLQAHYRYVLVPGNAWLAWLPGLAIVSVILALNLVAQGLRDAFDVRQN